VINLSNIGEILLSEMINRSHAVQELLTQSISFISLTEKEFIAVPEAQLNRFEKYGFDGAHKLDVALLFGNTRKCLGLEAKLGIERLNRREFDKRFLMECGTSHGKSRISGSIIAILEGKLPNRRESSRIIVKHQQTEYELLPTWILVVRNRILNDWSRLGRPSLSDHCHILPFEKIVGNFGGRDLFNSLVREILEGDYYREWIEGI